MTINKQVHIKLPQLPNFIKYTEYSSENSVSEGQLDVAELSEEDIKRLGQEWTTALLNSANDRRLARKNTSTHA